MPYSQGENKFSNFRVSNSVIFVQGQYKSILHFCQFAGVFTCTMYNIDR